MIDDEPPPSSCIPYFCKNRMRMRPILMVEGLRNLHDARYCAAVGISMASFDLSSDAALAPAMVREILEWLSGLEGLGVFQQEDGGMIGDKARAAGVVRVVLPLDFDWLEAEKIGLGIIVNVAQTQWPRIKTIAHQFPDALFLLPTDGVQNIQSHFHGDESTLLPRCILRCDDPDAIYNQLRQQNLQPYGFSLGAFASDENGQLDYDACDAFIQQYQELEPA
jgi:hypothetical protein